MPDTYLYQLIQVSKLASNFPASRAQSQNPMLSLKTYAEVAWHCCLPLKCPHLSCLSSLYPTLPQRLWIGSEYEPWNIIQGCILLYQSQSCNPWKLEIWCFGDLCRWAKVRKSICSYLSGIYSCNWRRNKGVLFFFFLWQELIASNHT